MSALWTIVAFTVGFPLLAVFCFGVSVGRVWPRREERRGAVLRVRRRR